jgi:hypothetical protein
LPREAEERKRKPGGSRGRTVTVRVRENGEGMWGSVREDVMTCEAKTRESDMKTERKRRKTGTSQGRRTGKE